MANKSIYFDYAAATPMDKDVLKSMEAYFVDKFYNPSATYLAGRAVRADINQARAKLASHLGARPAEIVFTAGATEANNLAIAGIMQAHPDAEMVVSAVEHRSVAEPAKKFGAREIAVDKNGVVNLGKLEKLITDKTVLISTIYVNSELGTIQPLAKISRLVAQVRSQRLKKNNLLPLYLHSDAAQAANFLDLHTSRLGVDLLSLNGGKIYGPKQSGVLYVRGGVKLAPQILGGGQEFNLRSGTENVAAVVGLAAALDKAQFGRQQNSKKLTNLRNMLEKEILTVLPQAVVNGVGASRAPHITSLTIPGADNERLMMQLDEVGIIIATGSACSASHQEPSHVLAAIGLKQADIRSTIRISLGRETSVAQVNKLVLAIKRLVAKS